MKHLVPAPDTYKLFSRHLSAHHSSVEKYCFFRFARPNGYTSVQNSLNEIKSALSRQGAVAFRAPKAAFKSLEESAKDLALSVPDILC